MRSLLILVGLFVGLSASALRAEDKPDPRENLDTAIPEGIRLLEKKDYEGYLRAFVVPKDLEKITAEKPLAEFAIWFGENKAELLLNVFKEINGNSPTLSEDKSAATFVLKKEVQGKHAITFQKIDKYWYIKN